MQEKTEKPLVLGRIGGIYGVRGWVKITSYTRPKTNILSYSPLLMKVNKEWQEIEIEDSQQRGDRLLAKIKGIDSPEEGKKLVHCDLAVTRKQLPALEEGEYYWHDLIGLEVFNQDKIRLGKVKNIIETGANDVLDINDGETDKRRILIPLIMDIYVKKVDLIAKKIDVDWQLDA